MYYTYEFRQNAAEIEIDHRMMFGRMDELFICPVCPTFSFLSVQFPRHKILWCMCVCVYLNEFVIFPLRFWFKFLLCCGTREKHPHNSIRLVQKSRLKIPSIPIEMVAIIPFFFSLSLTHTRSTDLK